MQKDTNIVFLTAMFLVLFTLILLNVTPVKSAPTNHIVFSEIQIAGLTANDEFIELYNPSTTPVDLTGWNVKKKAGGATATATNLVSTMSGTINGHGFYLLVNEDSPSSSAADLTYKASISTNNTLILNDNSLQLIDKVGMGTATDSETADAPAPATGKSIERKANSSSTSDSMKIGGVDELLGNGEDSDDNSLDFVLRDLPQPQNSTSSPEPVFATDTPTPSPTPTASPEPTDSPEPSDSPTPTASASPTPTATPTTSPTPPSPTPTPKPVIRFTCSVRFVRLNFGFFSLQIPRLICSF